MEDNRKLSSKNKMVQIEISKGQSEKYLSNTESNLRIENKEFLQSSMESLLAGTWAKGVRYMTTTKEKTNLEQQKEDLRGMILMLKQLTENEKREIKGIMIGMQLAKNIEPKKTA